MSFILPGAMVYDKLVAALNDQETTQYVCEKDLEDPESKWHAFILTDWFSEDKPAFYYDFYLFSITNPLGYLSGETAKIAELGPFVMQEFKKKINVDFEPGTDDTEITYQTTTVYAMLDQDRDLTDGTDTRTYKRRFPNELTPHTPVSGFSFRFDLRQGRVRLHALCGRVHPYGDRERLAGSR